MLLPHLPNLIYRDETIGIPFADRPTTTIDFGKTQDGRSAVVLLPVVSTQPDRLLANNKTWQGQT